MSAFIFQCSGCGDLKGCRQTYDGLPLTFQYNMGPENFACECKGKEKRAEEKEQGK